MGESGENGDSIQMRNGDAVGRPPKLLGLVLGRDRVLSLREFLLRIARTRPEASRLCVTLQGPSDHPNYQRLLDSTWCYLTPGAKELRSGFTLQQYSSQTDVLGRAIETLLQAPKGKKNVLIFGYGKRSSSARGKPVAGASRSEMYCVDGTAKSLCSAAWQLLLTRIGDTLMLYLFLNVSMFSTLENDCFFQLTGYPVTAAARAVKKTSQAQQGRLSIKENYFGGDEKSEEPRKGSAKETDGPRARKPQRPSSWQRKKYKRAKERGDEKALRELQSKRDRLYRKQIRQQFGISSPTGGEAGELSGVARETKRKQHCQHPRYLSRPSEMIIPRHSIFYCRRYSRKGGFPLAHILMRLDHKKSAGKILYQYIFNRRLNPVALGYNQRKPMHMWGFPKRRSVPLKHRYLIPWLNSIVRRAQRCRYNVLLNLHCPLPDECFARKDTTKSAAPVQRITGVKRARSPRMNGTSSMGMDGVKQEANDDEEIERNQAMNGAEDTIGVPQSDDASKEEIPDLSGSYVPHSHVASFVWAVIRRVIPKHILGGTNARKALRKAVHRFVGLKRYENMTAHEAIRGIPLSEMRWLDVHMKKTKNKVSTPPNRVALKNRMLLLWVGWLFGSFIVPLLRAHFYCTENESHRQQVFYYRKQVWSLMIEKSFRESLSTTFIPIKARIARAMLAKRKLGVSRLRFLPKRNGLRFLVNMSRKSEARFKSWTAKDPQTGKALKIPPARLHFEPINNTLKKAQVVLKSEAMRHPTLFGSSMYGFNDIFCQYKPFVNHWRSDQKKESVLKSTALSALKERFGPYAVCVDVSRAFDNVDVNTLLGIISELLAAEEYTIVKFTEIITIMGEIKVRFRNFAVPTGEMQNGHFSQKIASLSNGQKSRIFVDAITEDRVTRKDLLRQLKDYLSLNLVKLKKKWRYQCKGIAQGGKPSTMLCSLYLGYVERACLEPMIASCGAIPVISNEDIVSSYDFASSQNLTSLTALGRACGSSEQKRIVNFQRDALPSTSCPDRSHSLLLRLVDDWILITRHKSIAEQFASRILSGIPGFNILVNPNKTQVTFDLTVPGIGCMRRNEFVEADGSSFIKWCGLLIHTTTLEVRADYTRYTGEHLGASLNVPVQRNPGSALSSKLCHYIRPKLIPLLLDEEINSPLTIRINVYQTFLLGAMKLHCFMHGLPCPPDDSRSCAWILSAIDTGIRYAIDSSRSRRVASQAGTSTVIMCNPSLPHSHIEFLGLHAFYTVLRKKQSRYKTLLEELKKKLNQPRCKKCAPHLRDAIDPKHSSVFDSIMY